MALPHTQGLTEAPDGLDTATVDAAILGDREAFESLVHYYGPALHRYARRMLADEGDILEVVQDTFVAAWRRLDSFRGESSMRTWLFRDLFPKDRGQLSNQESATDRRQTAGSSRPVSRGRPVRHDLERRVPGGTGRSVG